MAGPKKAKKPARKAFTPEAATAKVSSELKEQAAESAEKRSTLAGRLHSADAAAREEACSDLTHMVLNASHRGVLVAEKVHLLLAGLLQGDDAKQVRMAAATALRNFVVSGKEQVADDLAGVPHAEEAGRLAIVVAIERNVAEAVALADELTAALAAIPAEQRAAEGGAEGSVAAGHQAHIDALHASADEYIQLATVMAEASDAAATALSASEPFLALVVGCLPRSAAPGAQVAAAECLRLLSDDNDALTAFMAGGLTPEQQAFLNHATSAVAISPSLQRVAMNLCGALINCFPTVANVAQVLPLIRAGVDMAPVDAVVRAVPLFSSECKLDEAVRGAGVAQALDRFRVMQASLDVLGTCVALLCEGHDEERDDEAEFAANPSAALLLSSGVVEALVARAGEQLMHLHDVLSRSSLRDPSHGGDVTTLQSTFTSVEVGVFSVVSSLMMLTPLSNFGSVQAMWDMVVAAIATRHELLEAEESADAPWIGHVVLQIESLAEMAWTVQRKVAAGVATTPAQLDVFTRCAWHGETTDAAKTSFIGAVGRIGAHAADAAGNYACGNFCVKTLSHAAARGGEHTEVAAEAADVLMDIYADERFDASAYAPLQVGGALRALLPVLQAHIASLKGARRGSQMAMLREHFREIADNVGGFLQYKAQHGV
jgi:hypothetical protein